MHARDELENVQEDARDDERVRRNSSNLGKLATDLDADAIHGTKRVVWSHAIQVIDPGLSKDTSEERSDHTANAVEFEDIHALVDSDPFVDVLA